MNWIFVAIYDDDDDDDDVGEYVKQNKKISRSALAQL